MWFFSTRHAVGETVAERARVRRTLVSVPGAALPAPAASELRIGQDPKRTSAFAAGPVAGQARKTILRLCTLTCVAAAAFASGPASAEPPATDAHAHPGDPAARALFYEARTLMKDGRYAAACPKLEESLRLEYGIGTEFNLADCNERRGQLASAWSGFVHVATAAKAQNQADREKLARERARALEPRVPKLVIDVPSPTTARLEITRDGTAVEAAAWGRPIPVDPGVHHVAASASGKQPWQTAVTANESAVVHVAVPRDLGGSIETPTPAPVAVPVPVPAAAAPTVVATTPPPTESAPAPQASFPAPVTEGHGRVQRGIGWVVTGLGVAGLGVGSGFAISSLRERQLSSSHCLSDRCDARGYSLRKGAIRDGNIATIGMAAGGATLLGGIILVLTAPRSERREAPPTASWRAAPLVATDGAGLSVEGLLP